MSASEYFRLQYLRYVTLRAYQSRDWREVRIVENNEPLVEVPREICVPYYAREMKLVLDERIYLREQVLVKVLEARDRLYSETGLCLQVYDGWRPIELQKNLFWYYMREFTACKFDLVDKFGHLEDFNAVEDCFNNLPVDMQKTLFEANRTYVSWPSKDPKSPSPHATGGSVDVWLADVSLGVPFDWMEVNAGAFYHLKLLRDRFVGNDRKICMHRTKLILSMARVGFSCYGPEFWHFNYGNQMDAMVKGENARYSYIEP